ncbi:MAG: 23S rRNA (adenine(2503)-C(2))-methyltransferase RlmN, partial [Acidobacteria bacterium]|nr:23S rRNA (adenine(2503)-C(2))-methyltransferase RlmN [Acidobacteriota bacterium]
MKHVLDMSLAELQAEVEALEGKRFAAKQILEWIWAKGVYDFTAMTNLSLRLREELSRRLVILAGKVVAEQRSRDGVIKLLL